MKSDSIAMYSRDKSREDGRSERSDVSATRGRRKEEGGREQNSMERGERRRKGETRMQWRKERRKGAHCWKGRRCEGEYTLRGKGVVRMADIQHTDSVGEEWMEGGGRQSGNPLEEPVSNGSCIVLKDGG